MFEEQRICVDCGKEFTAYSHKALRCKDCRYKHHLEVMREYGRKNSKSSFTQQPRKCIDCGKEFTTKNALSVRCPECRVIYNRECRKEYSRQYYSQTKKKPEPLRPAPKPKPKPEPVREKYDPNVCKRIKSCYYGGYMGMTLICDYLAKTGTSRQKICRAGECVVYKRKRNE